MHCEPDMLVDGSRVVSFKIYRTGFARRVEIWKREKREKWRAWWGRLTAGGE